MKIKFKRVFFPFLLGGLVFCSSLKEAQSFQIKVSEETFADMYAQIRVFYLNRDKDKDHNYKWNDFQIYKFRLAIKGQINPLVQFYGMLDANENEGYQAKLWEAGVQFTFAPEFVVKVGELRVPFSRHNFVARHDSVVMSSDGNYFLPSQFKDALRAVDPYVGGYRKDQPFKRTDFGTVIAGSIKDGLFKYYLGIFNNDRFPGNKVWRLTGGFGNATASPKDKKNFEYDLRLEFTPTFWGFKSEETVFDPSLRVRQTYLGKRDTMTFGLGYHHEKHLEGLNPATYKTSSLTRKAWAADFFVEKTFGKYIPGLELGYMYFDDTHLYQATPTTYKKGDAYTWYVDAHLIYKEKIGFGIPGIGFRYEYVNVDGNFQNKKDLAYDRYGVCFTYYLHGAATKLGIGFDTVKAKDALKAYIKNRKWEDSTTTWYVGLYAQF
ncbi:MAG: porin [Thermodesulfobacterium sp.]|nr:porin [Thermodesulfobacterium sp.]